MTLEDDIATLLASGRFGTPLLPGTAERIAERLRALAAAQDALARKIDAQRHEYHAANIAAEAERDAALAEVAQLREAISWALGEGNSNFGDMMPETGPRFWWRAELRRRAALAAKEPPCARCDGGDCSNCWGNPR
jgi:hypothetical protein